MRLIGLAVILALGLTLVPLAAEAQKKHPRIGILSASSPPSEPGWQQQSPFWQAMRELGWIAKQNIMVERRWQRCGPIACQHSPLSWSS